MTLTELKKKLNELKLVPTIVALTENGMKHDLVLRELVENIKTDSEACIVKGDPKQGIKYKYYIIDKPTGLMISPSRSIAQAKALMNGTEFAERVKKLRVNVAVNDWYISKKYEFSTLLEERLEEVLNNYLNDRKEDEEGC